METMTTPIPIPPDVAEAAERLKRHRAISHASESPYFMALPHNLRWPYSEQLDADELALADFALTLIAAQEQAADPFSVSARFVPDEQGGHLVAQGKAWRPAKENP